MQRDEAVDAELGIFGIEMDVLALRAIIEFAVDRDFRFGKARAQRQGFAPAAMADDQVGNKTAGAQFAQREENLGGAASLDVEAACERVSLSRH